MANVIQLQADFEIANLDSKLDALAKDVADKFKKKLEDKRIDAKITKLNLTVSKDASTGLTAFRDSVIKNLTESFATQELTVTPKLIKVKADKVNVESAVKEIIKKLEKALGASTVSLGEMKFDAGKINLLGVTKEIQQRFKEIVEQVTVAQRLIDKMEKAMAKRTATKDTSTTKGITALQDENGVFTSAASLAKIRDRMKSYTTLIQSENKKIQQAVATMQKNPPGSDTFKQAQKDLQEYCKRVSDAKALVDTTVKANPKLFTGTDADPQLLARLNDFNDIYAQASRATTAVSAGLGDLEKRSKLAQAGIKSLTKSTEEYIQARDKIRQASRYTTGSDEQSKLLKEAQTLMQTADSRYAKVLNSGALKNVKGLETFKDAVKQLETVKVPTTKLFDEAIAGADKLRGKVIDLEKSLSKLDQKNLTFKNEKFAKDIANTRQLVQSVASQNVVSAADVVTVQNAIKQLEAQSAQLQTKHLEKVQKIKQESTTVSEQIKAAQREYQNYMAAAKELPSLTPGTDVFNKTAQQAEQSYATLKKYVDLLQQAKTTNPEYFGGANSKAFDKLLVNFDKATTLQDRISPQVQAMTANLDKLKSKATEVQKAIAEIGSTNGKAMSSDKRFSQLESELTKAKRSLEDFKKTYQSLNLTKDSPGYQFINDMYKNTVSGFESQIKSMETEQKGVIKLQEGYESLYDSVKKFRAEKGSTLTSHGAGNLRQLETDLKKALSGNVNKLDNAELRNYSGQFRMIQTDLKAAGQASLTFAQNMERAKHTLSAFISGYMVFSQVVRTLRTMVGYVKEVDTAMTELRKVTDVSEAAYSQFLTSAADKAIDLGTKLSSVVDSTATFARLGYSLKDSFDLSESALKLLAVGDGIESAQDASEKIISAMKAFGIQAQDSARIVDVYNELGV